MVEMAAMEFIVFSVLISVAVAGFWFARHQSKSTQSLIAGYRKLG